MREGIDWWRGGSWLVAGGSWLVDGKSNQVMPPATNYQPRLPNSILTLHAAS